MFLGVFTVDIHDLIVVLDFLSRVIAVVLAIGGILGFFFRKTVGTWIETRFKASADAVLERYKGQLAESLEVKKATLAGELEQRKAQLTKELEQDKLLFSEKIRRNAYQFDKNTSFYETFDVEFSSVISELYALHADYIRKDENSPLIVEWRKIWLSRAHSMLIQADGKLALLGQYIDSELRLRVAQLFANLSAFMADAARDKKRLDELALEKGLLADQLRQSLVKTHS
jgi:hypothetical protein